MLVPQEEPHLEARPVGSLVTQAGLWRRRLVRRPPLFPVRGERNPPSSAHETVGEVLHVHAHVLAHAVKQQTRNFHQSLSSVTRIPCPWYLLLCSSIYVHVCLCLLCVFVHLYAMFRLC